MQWCGNDCDNQFPTTVAIAIRAPDLVRRPSARTTWTVSPGQVIQLSWTRPTKGTRTQDLAASASYSLTDHDFAIPNGLAPGTYYLILRTDGLNSVYEGTEEADNQLTAVAITVE